MDWKSSIRKPLDLVQDTYFPDPTKQAGKTLDRIPGQMKQYYDPYVKAGQNAIPGYQDMMSLLMTNPDEFLNRIGQGYKKSPGYDWNLKQGEAGIENAQAAGGMLGSPQHEQENAEMASGLASKDYNEYMNRAMQGLGIGAAGTGNIFNTGANMSSDLATSIANILSGKANLQYAGQEGRNKRTGDMMGMISKFAMGG